MTPAGRSRAYYERRLAAAAAEARAAEAAGDGWAAAAAWRRHDRIRDALRPADELLAEAQRLLRTARTLRVIGPAARG